MALPLKKNKIINKSKKNATNNNKIKYATHLYNHDKYLTNIKSSQSYKYLNVLYLHNNLITKIENLDAASNLSSLYLQKNKISKIENLNSLVKLRKLYLGHNEISVVENLDNLHNLEELYIEKQNLINGDALCFDPRTIHGLAFKLQILNIASNNISTITTLEPLKFLVKINASNNSIPDTNDICRCIETWKYLKEAWFFGNPSAKRHRYREDIIGATINLTFLDDKEIKEATRCFIKRFEQEKASRGSKQNVNINELASFDIPLNYPPPVQKAVYNYVVHPNQDAILNTENPYIAWNSMPKTRNKVPLIIKKQKKTLRNKEKFNTPGDLFPNIFK